MNSNDSNIWNDEWLNELYTKEAERERKREREPVDPKEKENDQEEGGQPKRQRVERIFPGELPEAIPHLSAMWDGPTGNAEQAQGDAAADIQSDSGIHSSEGTTSGTYLRLTPNDIQSQCPACLNRLLKRWTKLSTKGLRI
jgi:hypothetical protein